MISGDEFRSGMSRWATGVTIVTSCAGKRVHGMTVSDFSGVSLSPPLVMVCADRSSNTHALIAEGKCFAVNVLAADQQDISNHFASKETESNRFDGIEFTTGKTGSPMFEGVRGSGP